MNTSGASDPATESQGTVAFDVVGTLFSLDAVRRVFERHGLPGWTTDLWMAQALRDYFASSHSGDYIPLSEILTGGLPRTLALLHAGAPGSLQDDVRAAFQDLEPADGAVDALRAASRAGWRVLAVTNGARSSTESRLERWDLDAYVQAVVSCDDLELSKPHPDVYGTVRERTGEGDTWLVAAHAWDVAGASRSGLRTAWISSLERTYLDPYPTPDIKASDLSTAVRAILRSAPRAPGHVDPRGAA